VTETDLEAALDAANARTLEAADARVVVISDGRPTSGDAVGAAGRSALRGAVVHAMPVGHRHDKPPQVVAAEPPADAHGGLPAAVRVTVGADRPTRLATRLIDADGKVADPRELPVDGRKTAVLRFTPRKPGGRNVYRGRRADRRPLRRREWRHRPSRPRRVPV